VATYQHPGIYIEEIPSARSIQGVSTSVPAFVGVTELGVVETPTLITSWSDYTRQFGNLVWYGYVSWAVFEFFNEGGTSCYVVRTKDTDASKTAAGKLSNLSVSAATTGTWGNNLSVIVSNSGNSAGTTPVFNISVAVGEDKITTKGDAALDVPAQLLAAYVQQNKLAPTSISQANYYVLESFNGFSISSASATATAASAQSLQTRINSTSIFIRVDASKLTSRPSNTGKPTSLNSGTDPVNDFDSGLKKLLKVDGISLLSMPDTTTAVDASKKVTQSGQAAIVNLGLLFCEQIGSMFYVSDPPFGLDVQDIGGYKMGTGPNTQALNSSYGSIYYPWVWIFNSISNSNIPIPPSGPVLGRYAYTDQNSGVFKSPAGVSDGALKTVTSVQEKITDADQDFLNPEGINAIRNFIGYGNTIWGARTLSSDTQWTYVAIRRLFIYVEQSLKQSLQWVVFEPNDQTLWSSVSRDISAFLQVLWQQGGLFGNTAKEAFYVTCDASNNPPETRALGQLYIDIGLAVVYPAEFVIIRVTQKTAGPDSGN
jgi:Phage tail sheath protein FI